MSRENITVSKRGPDGTYYRKSGEEWIEEKTDEPLFGPNFPEGEPVYDPENPPLTKEQLSRMKRVAFAKHLRFMLGLTQEQFSERYHIPIGTLRDWEQHRSEPDAPAKAYLQVIAADPEGAAAALARKAKPAAE
jgi:putative transcriptional regulator